MIIQEAPWEKRNLGVSAVNFIIEKQDTIEVLNENVLDNRDYQYQVVKLPVNKMDMYQELCRNGFEFIEGKAELSCTLADLKLQESFRMVFDEISYKQVFEQEDFCMIYDYLLTGLFDNDRIALDPMFGKAASARRYLCWTRDEVESGHSLPFIAYVNDIPIGFAILKPVSKKIAYSMLMALFDRKGFRGMGFALLYINMLEAKKRGFKSIITEVSTNNIDSLKLHLMLGYNIKDMHYVLIKHNMNNEIMTK